MLKYFVSLVNNLKELLEEEEAEKKEKEQSKKKKSDWPIFENLGKGVGAVSKRDNLLRICLRHSEDNSWII